MEEDPKDERCDICGGVADVDLIVTCSQCNITREHAYCMRILRKEIPDVWICEACMSTNDSGRQGCFKRQKAKVKYLPIEEVIRLSSGARISTLLSASTLPTGSSNAIASMSNRTPIGSNRTPIGSNRTSIGSNRTTIGSKPVTPNLSPQTVKANPDISSSRYAMPPRRGSKQISSTISQQAPQTVKRLEEPTSNATPGKENVSEPKAIVTPTKEYVCKERSVATSAKKAESSNAMAEKVPNKATCPSSTPVYCPPTSISRSDSQVVTEPKNCTSEYSNRINILPKLKLSLPCFPARDATWKGVFKIVDVSPSEIYDGILAHPPSRVHPKAYEFSQKMPPTLQVNLLPRFHLWADLFPDNCPDLHDIGLYFFPGNFDRLKRAYASLLDHMEIHDAVMRGYFDGVELLIFTSKQLHVDSQNLIASSNTEYFLWGIFRRAKNEQNIDKMHKEHPALGSPLESACDDHSNMDDSAVMDMEIDMVGGVNVGSIDKVVSKKSSHRLCGTFMEEIGYQCSLQKPKRKSSSVSRGLESTVHQNFLECKRIQCNYSDVPVGIAQKVESDFALKHPLQNSSGKFSNAIYKMGIPPGFENVLSDVSCKATFTDEKPRLNGSRVVIKAEGNYDEKLVGTREKELGYTPFRNKISSENGTGLYGGDGKKYNQFLPVKVKPEVKKFEFEDFSHKQITTPQS